MKKNEKKEDNLVKFSINNIFEEEVRIFIKEKLGLLDVKGGENFYMVGNTNVRIGACGRYNDILFIFECRASNKKTKKTIKADIKNTKEFAKNILKNYKNIAEYSQCKYVKFIFITKKIVISDDDKNLFNHDVEPHFWYTDESILEYYSDLYEKIGKYATFNFLADYGIRPPENEKIEVPAIKTKIGKYTAYNFFINPKQLIRFSYVARRRAKNENFYQRMLDKSRINKILKFVESGGIFPTNIILSLKYGDREFIENNDSQDLMTTGILTIKNSYSACWIIDGQHRLYSFAKSNIDSLVSCTAFDQIDIEDERKFFLEINKEQKPIQPDLVWDLEGLSDSNSDRGRISNIVRTLNNREPFLGKIYIPVQGSRIGKIINMAAFCNGIYNASLYKSILPNCVGIENPLFSNNAEIATRQTALVLQRYFSYLKNNLNDDQIYFVFGNAGIPILLYILEPIIGYIGHIPSNKELAKYAAIIVEFFKDNYGDIDTIKKLKLETNSEGARKTIAKQIGFYVRKAIKDEKFWPQMERDEFVDDIIRMERRIAVFISSCLGSITTAWEKQRIPDDINRKAKERMEKDGTTFEENFCLGDELRIIIQKNNWKDIFEKKFISKNGFKIISELELAFNYLSEIRNPVSHGKSVVPSKDNLKQAEIYFNKLQKIIPEIIYDNTEE